MILADPTSASITALTAGDAEQQFSIAYDPSSKTYSVSTSELSNQQLRESDSYPASKWGPKYFNFGPANDDSFFHVVSVPDAEGERKYSYSNVALWGKGTGAYWDDASYTAFGQVTPNGAVPTAGKATYSGAIYGTSDIRLEDGLIGGTVPSAISGSVSLDFDFGAGKLSGSITPELIEWEDFPLATLFFTETVFSVGSQSYAGKFDTTLEGPNYFTGLFTGPNAQETIGRWAFPFERPSDGALHNAWGVWLARPDPSKP
ncbi:hypothetical protein P7228_02590 [Altererythrobacter arenosus]|uniref:Transferrin-binding protein B C-lobe/N-lobe beta barrel domain-containing protein n=1 Tax=Altererythrobacter arenosus TaxID=3032592 RepID=A0ABY8FVK4_9SPHN|nr:hypothetical protein [Altererythrobacter sp. CAU 1644]WFL77973.1 hypothetical protein P7228_02590 [Altererythrobacter sp. CAU 1644]